jgi:hypothetical protein
MNGLLLSKGFFPAALLHPSVEYLLRTQLPSGCIPWFTGAQADPWDHIEAAMGLTIGGELAAARRAYDWLAKEQLADGSWWSRYEEGQPRDLHHRETHHSAYVAVGVWHYFRVTGDREFLQEFFPCVSAAVNFVLSHQAPSGEIYWAVNQAGESQKDALVTACASIYKSLECALLIADTLNQPRPQWASARERLGHCLLHQPQCFDRTWESKARFSMDWFYPVIAGLYSPTAARTRLEKKWSLFVENQQGCRCVSDQPWVTVAESCELTLALLAAGEHAKAVNLFSWLHQWLDDDGGYWTGYNFRDGVIWPREKTTWTLGAVLLAADALTEHTGAAHMFTRVAWRSDEETASAERGSTQLYVYDPE